LIGKRFDVVYEEDDEYKNIRYWEIIDTKSQNSTSNELEIVKLLNELDERWIGELNLRETLQLDLQRVEEENKELRKVIMNLQKIIQFDVDNGIKIYPKTLSEYLANALKVILND